MVSCSYNAQFIYIDAATLEYLKEIHAAHNQDVLGFLQPSPNYYIKEFWISSPNETRSESVYHLEVDIGTEEN